MTNKELEEFNKHRKIWQICAVTNDLERTMQQWVDKLKIGPWKVRSFNSENMDYEYVGDRMLDKEKEPWEFRIGITMVGDFEIEIIQPVKGPTIFQDWLDRHGEGIHHFKEMARNPQFFSLATRVIAELGAQLVKCYYCEDFEKITAGCPVPIVVAGGKKLPIPEALSMAYHAISEGAHGMDMGRNIFQAEDPKAMAQAVAKIVHEGFTDKEAYEFYRDTACVK